MRDIRVLHVDDEPALAEVVVEFLTSQDDRFTVETVTDAREALDRLEEVGPQIDCIVSDYDMPEIDGLEFLEAVRADRPDLPFILFTGKGSEEVASDAIGAGATDYLQKKAGAEAYELLANRIRNSVQRHRQKRDIARYETIVQTARDGIYTLDPEGNFTTVNDYIVERTGYPRTELVGSHVSILLDDEDIAEGVAAIQDLRKDPTAEAASQEIEVHPKDGEPMPVELTIALLPTDDDTFRGTVGIARDISEQKRAESRFRSLFENIPDPAVIAEFDDGEPYLDTVNPAFEATFGYPSETAVGRSLNELIVPDRDRQQETARTIDQQAKAHEQVELEVRRETATGDILDCLFRNALIEPRDAPEGSHFGVYTDITERKVRERELERVEAILEGMTAGVFAIDTHGRFTYVNRALEEATGHDRDDLIDEEPTVVFRDEAAERLTAAVTESVTDEEPVELEVDLIGTSGPTPVVVSLAKLSGESTETDAVGVIRDAPVR